MRDLDFREKASTLAMDRLLAIIEDNSRLELSKEELRSGVVRGLFNERFVQITKLQMGPYKDEASGISAEKTIITLYDLVGSENGILSTSESLDDFEQGRIQHLKINLTIREALDLFTNEEYERLSRIIAVDYESNLLVPANDLVVVQASLLDLLRRNPLLLAEISHRQFEELLFELLRAQGFEVHLTARTRDGGCDLIAVTRDCLGITTKYIVEAKHYGRSKKVGVGAVRQLSAVRQKLEAHHGLLVTSSYFTKPAKEENESYYGLHLRDYESLLGWLRSA